MLKCTVHHLPIDTNVTLFVQEHVLASYHPPSIDTNHLFVRERVLAILMWQ